MPFLSKSKIMAGRQCPKRLYLEVHHPELLDYSDETQRLFSIGHEKKQRKDKGTLEAQQESEKQDRGPRFE